MVRQSLIFLALLSLLGCSAKSPQQPVVTEKGPWVLLRQEKLWGDLTASEYKFPNGLKAVLVPDTQAPVYAFQIWFNVGSRDEKLGKTGIAHLFEHLMFKATKNVEDGGFDRLITSLGGDSNAATWLDWTYYREEIPSGTLETIMKLEADRMVNLILNKDQVESERQVVLNERRFRVDNNPSGLVYETLYKLAFSKHPYGWPTIGWEPDIKAITIEDTLKFYKTFYAPNNATIVIVGDFDPNKALTLINKYFGSLPSQTIAERNLPVEPPQELEKRGTIKQPVPTEKLVMGWHIPKVADPEHAAVQVMNLILFTGKSSRLYQVLVENLQLATEVGGWVAEFADPGLLELEVTLREQHTTGEAEGVIYDEIERFKREGPSSREVQKAKNQLESGYYRSVATVGGKAEVIGHFQVTVGDFAFTKVQLASIQKVNINDVRRVSKQILTPANRTVVEVKKK